MTETRLNPDGVMEEVEWIDVKGWEDLYAVNQFGEVKSYSRLVNGPRGGQRRTNEIILKPKVREEDGFMSVTFQIKDDYGGQRKNYYIISRLVAEAFLGFDKEDHDYYISYYDHNTRNVYYKNLEITTPNIVHSVRRIGCDPPVERPITIVFEDGSKAKYSSITHAARCLGLSSMPIRKRIDADGRMIHGFSCRDTTEDESKLNLPSTVMSAELWAEKCPVSNVVGSKLNQDDEMEELIWVDVKGYEGLYAVNQFGEVRSYSRTIIKDDGSDVYLHGRILVGMRNKETGAVMVNLFLDKIQSSHNVRRLVAEAFLGLNRSDKSLYVTNKHGAPDDNYYKNIEVVPMREVLSVRNMGREIVVCKSVRCTDRSGKSLTFKTVTEAAKHFNLVDKATITNRAKHPDKFYKGWRWSYHNLPAQLLLSKDDRDQAVRASIEKGLSDRAIMKLHHVSSMGLKNIRNPVVKDKPAPGGGRVSHGGKYVATLEEINEKISTIFEDSYKFPHIETEYVSTRSIITAICPIHGEFKVKLKDILTSKTGCQKCAPERSRLSRKHGQEESLKMMIKTYTTINKRASVKPSKTVIRSSKKLP